MPEDMYELSAIDVERFSSLFGSLVKVKTFSPDSNLGFDGLIESGIYKLPDKHDA